MLRIMCMYFVVLVLMTASVFSSVSNFSLIDSLTFAAARDIVQHLPTSSTPSQIKLELSDHAARWLMYQNVLRALNEKNIQVSRTSALLQVGIADCAVRYSLGTDRDSLSRIVRVELRAVMSDSVLAPVVLEYKDHISRAEMSSVETPKYDFCSSAAPAVPRSTWDDVLEPLIILSALATTVILLFSVRSQ